MSHGAWVGSTYVSNLPDTGKAVLAGGTPRRNNVNADIETDFDEPVTVLDDAPSSLVEHVKKRKQKDARKQKGV